LIKKTKRAEVKDLLKRIYELNPIAQKNIFRSMNNVFAEYIPKTRI